MSSSNSTFQSSSAQLRTVGSLWIVYGVIRLVLAALLILYTGTVTVMFGTLLNRVADPFTLMSFFISHT